MRTASQRESWLSGLVLGVLGGFLLLEFPAFGVLLLSGAAILVTRPDTRGAGLGGLAIGFGAVWVAVLAHARIACSDGTWQGCSPAPLTDGYLIAGVAILVAGAVLTMAASRHAVR